MHQITLTISGRAHDGFLAAAAKNNVSLTDFVATVLTEAGVGYADLLRVGRITSAAFIQRFSVQEYNGILGASESSLAIKKLIEDLVKEPEITLDDPRLQNGLQVLVAAGLLAESRVEELLAHEIPT